MQISNICMGTGTFGRGYFIDTEGRIEKTIREYVRNQHQENIASDQMCLREFKKLFTGEPVGKGK